MLELRAYLVYPFKRKPFHLRVSEPFDSGEGDYYCEVNVPELFDDVKKIYGVDAAQAIELAVRFVDVYLGHVGVAVENENGEPTSVQEAIKPIY